MTVRRRYIIPATTVYHVSLTQHLMSVSDPVEDTGGICIDGDEEEEEDSWGDGGNRHARDYNGGGLWANEW